MHCGFTVMNWRASYEFLPLFWINSFLLGIVSGFIRLETEDNFYFITKFTASVVSGLLFDYLPTKGFLVSMYLLGSFAGILHYLPVVWVVSAHEVIILTYSCEVLVDNCKFTGLAEIITLQLVSNSLGSILFTLISPFISLYSFVLATTFVLFIVNFAVFQETLKISRPLFNPDSAKTVLPRFFGVFICMLILFSSGSQSFSLPALVQSSFLTLDFVNCIKIFITPLTFLGVYKLLQFQKISFVLIFFLVAAGCAWACVLWEYTELLAVIGVLVTSAYCKCAGLVLLSRVLGPYYNGKFFGVGLATQYIFRCIFLTDWWIEFIIGAAACVLTIACLAPGLKYCEYHRDYVIGRLSSGSPAKKKQNFKITLKRASLLEN